MTGSNKECKAIINGSMDGAGSEQIDLEGVEMACRIPPPTCSNLMSVSIFCNQAD